MVVPVREERIGVSEIQPPAAAATRPPQHPVVRLVVELGPLLIFFFANARWGIFAGTGAFMAAILVSFSVSLWMERRVPVMPLVTAVIVLVFGGLTLFLQDETFIKLKPTILYSLFAAILAFGLATGRNFLQIVLGSVLQVDPRGWRILTVRWALFFVAMAVVNELVWRTFSTDTWVSFKLFGFLPLTFAFSLAQVPLLNRHQIDPKAHPSQP
jgi:intracellular septation protein